VGASTAPSAPIDFSHRTARADLCLERLDARANCRLSDPQRQSRAAEAPLAHDTVERHQLIDIHGLNGNPSKQSMSAIPLAGLNGPEAMSTDGDMIRMASMRSC
jgi:hypothetical protein